MKENQKIVIQSIGRSFREATNIVTEFIGPPGPHEVLIRNHYAGVNGVYDEMMCMNRIDHTSVTPPASTGVEAVGVIEEVGKGVDTLAVDMSVATVNVGRGYCQYQICTVDEVIPVMHATPDILSLIPTGISGLLALEKVGKLGSGENVAITAAAGGLGNIMVQLAVNAGNNVIAICGSDAKAEWLESVGVQRTIQYTRESVVDVLCAEFKDEIDLAMDSVGGEVFDALLENLAPFGRLVVCGFTSDRLPPKEVLQERVYTKLYWKAASIHGFMNYRFSEYSGDARTRLLEMLKAGTLKPLQDKRRFIGLRSVADAVEHLLAGNNIGKVTVDLR